ncbi:Protocadherin-11 X-linked, partial [Clonorchis sinensis]
YYLHSQNDDTFELVQVAPVSSEAMPGISHPGNVYQSLGPYDTPMARSSYYPDAITNVADAPFLSQSPSQLYLKLARPLDWETKKSYKYVLIAEDNGSPSLTGQMELQVIVTDENDNHPVFQNKTYTISIPENAAEGRRLIQLIAYDPDEGRAGKVIYSLADNVQESSYSGNFKKQSSTYENSRTIQNSSGPFLIEPLSGWLILNGKLDYERSKHHLIRVLARDEAGHPGFDESVVNLMVTDVNDVAPFITVEPVLDMSVRGTRDQKKSTENTLDLYVQEVSGWVAVENEPLLLSSNDQFSSSQGQTSPLLAFVAVNDPDTGSGGQVQCGLKHDTKPDGHSMTNYQAQNSKSPFQSSTGTNQIHMATISGQFHFNPISRTQFELKTVGGFDHERNALEQVVIVCMDFGEPSLSSSFTINVHVEDINDNAPQFMQPVYQFSIEENRPSDTVISKVVASDQDSGQNAKIEYFLDNTDTEFFRINAEDGTIHAKTSFDRELRQNYRFQVFARDQGIHRQLTGTTTVEVTVLDTNDNAPMFVGLDSDNCYKFRVAENEPANTHVGILLGTDMDTEENAQLRFRLVTSTSVFKLDSVTGELTTIQSLDRERQPEYELVAMLLDKGRPQQSATAKILIHVTDVNDHDPIIVFPANGRGNVSVSFREPPGEVVARIEARDPDEGHNSLLHYSLIKGNRNSIFRLGSTSAELIIDRDLDESYVGTYILHILIQDAGVPPRSSQVQLTVQVTDSPARIYSHRYPNIRGKQTSSEENSNPTGKYQRVDGLPMRQDDRADKSAGLTSSENSIVSAGAILVAIVALSCAIILVLLGITVYLCGKKGFGMRRAYVYNRNRRNNCDDLNRTTGLDMYKATTLNTKPIEVDTNNSTPLHFPETVFVDPNSGTLLRCPVGSFSSTPASNQQDYGNHKLIRMSTPVAYESYTTCVPINERVPHSGNYETFHAPHILVPILPSHMRENSGETVTNGIGGIRKQDFPNSVGYAAKPGTIARTSEVSTARGCMIEATRFTQSLKVRRPDREDSCESPVSEGSTIKHQGNHIYRAPKVRTSRSWESLLTLSNPKQKSVQLEDLSTGDAGKAQFPSFSPIRSNKPKKVQDLHWRVTWNPVLDNREQSHQTEPNVSTFLPHTPRQTVTKVQTDLRLSQVLPGEIERCTPQTTRHLILPPGSFTGAIEDKEGYSRLIRETRHLNAPLGRCAIQQSCDSPCMDPLCTRNRQASSDELIDLQSRNGNLIDLAGSDSQNSTCSQICDCPVDVNEPAQHFQSLNSISLGEQAEFV